MITSRIVQLLRLMAVALLVPATLNSAPHSTLVMSMRKRYTPKRRQRR